MLPERMAWPDGCRQEGMDESLVHCAARGCAMKGPTMGAQP